MSLYRNPFVNLVNSPRWSGKVHVCHFTSEILDGSLFEIGVDVKTIPYKQIIRDGQDVSWISFLKNKRITILCEFFLHATLLQHLHHE